MALDPKRRPSGIPGRKPAAAPAVPPARGTPARPAARPASAAAPKAAPAAAKPVPRPAPVVRSSPGDPAPVLRKPTPPASAPVIRQTPAPAVPVAPKKAPVAVPLSEDEILAAEEAELSRTADAPPLDSPETGADQAADIDGAESVAAVESGDANAAALRRWRRIVAALAVACLVLGVDAWYLAAYNSVVLVSDGDAAAPASASGKPAPAVRASLPAKRDAAATILVGENALRGATVAGCDNGAVLIDGNCTDYDGDKGYAHYTMTDGDANAGITVNMPKPQKISRVRFLLWDKDPRTYGYVVSISADGKKWKTVKDASAGNEKSWQTINFDPQNVLAIKIRGTSNSANSGFHIVEVEAYDAGKAVPKRLPPAGPLPSEAALKPGLCVEYFDGIAHYPTVANEPTLIRATSELCFGAIQPPQGAEGLKNWPLSGPCAAIFSGYIKISKQDLYIFHLESDDGSNLYIDGQLVTPNDGKHAMTPFWGQIELKPGLHRFWIEYFNAGGGMGLNVQYEHGGGDAVPIPATALFHDPNEVQQAALPVEEEYIAHAD